MTYPLNEIDPETSEVDAAEQVPSWQDNPEDALPPVGEASEWDAQEQARVVEFDDDYR